jgi:uncharacterized protein YbjT (DUF2867 family)
MPDRDRPILVTGATGKQGGATARHLRAEGWTVRAMTRDPSQPKARLLADLGIEVVRANLDDASSVARALEGVYGVFSVQSFAEHGAEGEVRQGKLLADLAQKAGVQHFVYTSVGGAERAIHIPHFETKWQIEEHIRAIGVPATIIRPVAIMESFTYPFFLTMICTGILPGIEELEERWQLIAAEDVGRITGAIFREPATFMDQALEIAGDEISLHEAAAVFSRVIRRPVRYMRLTPHQLHPSLALQLESFANHGKFQADVPALRARWPELLTLERWLHQSGWGRIADAKPLANVML